MDRLENLEVFVAAAESGSFTQAGQRLGKTPAAVTRAVAALEARTGLRLFNRTTRAMALTEAGGRYLDQAKRALAEFAAARRADGEAPPSAGRKRKTGKK